MQVYKTFFKVAKSYKAGIIMYCAIVIVMVFALNSMFSTNDPTKVVQKSYSLLVVDEDHSEVSEMLIVFLRSKHTLKKGSYTDDQIKDMLYYQSIAEYIVIPKGFGDKFNEMATENDSSAEASSLLEVTYDDALPRGIFVNMQINEYLNAVSGYMKQDMNLNDANKTAQKTIDTSSFVSTLEKETNKTDSIYTVFTFLPFGILSIIFSGVLPVIISFNETEKKNRTAISKIRMTARNTSLVMATATLAFLVTTILIIVATLPHASEYAFTKMWWLAVLNSFIYTLSITMLLSMLTSLPLGISKKGSANTTAFVTNIIGLSFAFLGGTFVDLTILGDEVAKMGRFTPNYWYSVASREIWMNGAGLNGLLAPFGIQLLFGVVCLSVGLVFTKFFGNANN